jgi:hypothetical protein
LADMAKLAHRKKLDSSPKRLGSGLGLDLVLISRLLITALLANIAGQLAYNYFSTSSTG